MTLIEISEKTGFSIEEIRKKARMYGIFEHRLTQEKIEILMKQYKNGYVLISSKMNF